MKKSLVVFACAFIVPSIVQVAVAGNDFYGIIESRPDGKVGTWVVGGRSVEVTERTDLDDYTDSSLHIIRSNSRSRFKYNLVC